jgi:hypothetical protein
MDAAGASVVVPCPHCAALNRVPREKLEDRYGKIAIPALAAALDAAREPVDKQRQMAAENTTRLQQMAQS